MHRSTSRESGLKQMKTPYERGRAMIRRLYVVAVLILASCWSFPLIAHAQDDYLEPGDFPFIPTATSAWMGGASKLDVNTLLTEPSIMAVYVFGFEEVEDAQAAYPEIAKFYSSEAATQGDRDYREVSIGATGDERLAIYDQSTDVAQSLYSIVRIDSAIQVLWLVGIGGDLPSFASEYIQMLIPSTSTTSISLVPTISNLPVGWSPLFDAPVDILSQINQAGPPPSSATATANNLPSPTPQSTEVPVMQREGNDSSLATITSLEDQLATSKADLESAQETIEVLNSNQGTGALHPEPVTLVVQVDLYGLLTNDAIAIEEAREELESVLKPYLGGESCQIGFALISSRANELGQGVELSQDMGDLIESEFPQLLLEGSEGLTLEAIALPGTEPVGEVQLRLFLYAGCSVFPE